MASSCPYPLPWWTSQFHKAQNEIDIQWAANVSEFTPTVWKVWSGHQNAIHTHQHIHEKYLSFVTADISIFLKWIWGHVVLVFFGTGSSTRFDESIRLFEAWYSLRKWNRFQNVLKQLQNNEKKAKNNNIFFIVQNWVKGGHLWQLCLQQHLSVLLCLDSCKPW